MSPCHIPSSCTPVTCTVHAHIFRTYIFYLNYFEILNYTHTQEDSDLTEARFNYNRYTYIKKRVSTVSRLEQTGSRHNKVINTAYIATRLSHILIWLLWIWIHKMNGCIFIIMKEIRSVGHVSTHTCIVIIYTRRWTPWQFKHPRLFMLNYIIRISRITCVSVCDMHKKISIRIPLCQL